MTRKEFNTNIVSLKNKVYRFARMLLKNNEDAEDITQDIFEKLWVNRNEISNYKNTDAFVMQSVKNLCLDKIKHNKIELKYSTHTIHTTSTSIEPEDDTNEMSILIKNIINNLPEKQRIIMHLRDIEGYEFNEISEITGETLNNIRVNLSRARASVKQNLLKKINYGLSKN
ncbi:MAG: sigma-70 family RNA polymerase sigma factor [Chlorobi bacterium]|nr:sigma-70 family RNA polymerase sigma factor [Chlorobiota bacterium]